MNRNNFLPYLVLLSALLLAISAAYFSISGLSKLFSGSAISVIIMASVLELSKIVTASFVHTFWSKLSRTLKFYLASGVVVLSIITSIGIYGFLSNAYTITSGKLDRQSSEVVLLEGRKTIFEEQKVRYEEEINRKNARITQIINLRTQQESRIDSLYKKGLVSAAKNTEKTIRDSDEQIKSINNEIDVINTSINAVNDSIGKINIDVIGYQNSDIAAEIGPLRFISEITGASMDSIVNILILMFVFVFDPLAITLVIASNIAFDKNKEENNVSEELKIEEVSNDEVPLEEEVWLESDVEKVTETDGVKEENADEGVLEETSEDIEEIQEVVLESVSEGKEETKDEAVDEGEDDALQSVSEAIQEVEHDGFDADINDAIRESSQSDLIKSIDKKNSDRYKELLGVLFMDGALGVGDNIPSYGEFIKTLRERGLTFEKNEIKDFLILCNVMKIIYMDDSDKKILRDYEESKKILSMIF